MQLTHPEKDKSGLHPQEVEEFVAEASSLPGFGDLWLNDHCTLTENPEEVRPVFSRGKGEPAAAAKPAGQNGLLSMGMSGDFEVALRKVPTSRIGTAILGGRFRKRSPV